MLMPELGTMLRQLILDLSELRDMADEDARDNLIAEMIGDVTDLATRCAAHDAADFTLSALASHDDNAQAAPG